MSFKIEKRKLLLSIVLIIQLIMRDGFFDLYGMNDSVIASVRLRDLYFILEVGWLLIVLLHYKGKICNPFAGLAWAFLAIIIINCFTSYWYFNQPFTYGFQAQRDIFSGFCFLLAWSEIAYRHEMDSETIMTIVKKLCILKLFLNTLHWILYSYAGIELLQGAQLFTERYGEARIVFSQVEVVSLLAAICVNDILHEKNIVWNLIIYAWALCFFMVETKLRASTVASILAVTVVLLLWKKAGIKKGLVIVSAVVVVIMLADRIPLVQDVIETLFGSGSTSTNTMITRGNARLYYTERFLKSPFIGWGYPHTDWSAAFSGQGKALGYNFSDNGIFSFLYIYGGLGMVWLICFINKYVKYTRMYYKVEHNYIGIYWGIYQLVMLITGMFWIIGNYQLSFMLVPVYFMAKLNEEYNEIG